MSASLHYQHVLEVIILITFKALFYLAPCYISGLWVQCALLWGPLVEVFLSARGLTKNLRRELIRSQSVTLRLRNNLPKGTRLAQSMIPFKSLILFKFCFKTFLNSWLFLSHCCLCDSLFNFDFEKYNINYYKLGLFLLLLYTQIYISQSLNIWFMIVTKSNIFF